MPQTPCPYCGHLNDTDKVDRCGNCNGLFEPLSQIATQLAMGPWFVRDEDRPFMPGFSEAILRQQVRAGRITANTVLRGPTTNQFWMSAANTPGVSRLMGTCHACHQAVEPTDTACQFCKADLSLPEDVDALGLRYTDDASRAAAQQEIAEGRASAAATPKPTPTTKPAPAAPKPAPTPTAAATPAPAQPEPPATSEEPAEEPAHEEAYHEESDAADELAEDVWHAGAGAPARRRRKKKGADPLVIGMGVLLLCVFALGGMILLTSGGNEDDKTLEDDQPDPSVVERDSVAVSRASVPALTAYERLVPDDIPAEFEDRYLAIRRKVQQAEADKEAKRFNEAYDLYKEIDTLIAPLESDIAKWEADELAKAEASKLLDRVNRLLEQAQAAEAQRWATKDWQEAEKARQEAERLFAAGQFAQAGEQFAVAEPLYLSAQNKAQAGQTANNARNALEQAIKASSSEKGLRQYANDQIEAMLRLRTEADGKLNEQQYAAAEQSYNDALDALRDAQRIVELARYKKFYAFDAGFRASGLMLAAARGDGVDASSKKQLADLFEKLGILPNPATGIQAGDEVGITAAIKPLVNDARDAIIQRHGEMVQACYLIGFHASIIDQSLKTKSLTDDQQKRIHQSLGTIEQEASKAGWNTTKLNPAIDRVRQANRNAKLKADPEATRAAWARLLAPIRSKQSAPALMEPSPDNGDATDPELFPTNGS